jgi:hypothetical protein
VRQSSAAAIRRNIATAKESGRRTAIATEEIASGKIQQKS